MIQITDNLAIIADANCYIVGKPVKKRDGSVFIRDPKYYSTIGQALRGTVNIALRTAVSDGTITTLRQFVNEHERLEGVLQDLLATDDNLSHAQENEKEANQCRKSN